MVAVELKLSLRQQGSKVKSAIRGHESDNKRRNDARGEEKPAAGDAKVISKIPTEVSHLVFRKRCGPVPLCECTVWRLP